MFLMPFDIAAAATTQARERAAAAEAEREAHEIAAALIGMMSATDGLARFERVLRENPHPDINVDVWLAQACHAQAALDLYHVPPREGLEFWRGVASPDLHEAIDAEIRALGLDDE